jgi:hypothetical protein
LNLSSLGGVETVEDVEDVEVVRKAVMIGKLRFKRARGIGLGVAGGSQELKDESPQRRDTGCNQRPSAKAPQFLINHFSRSNRPFLTTASSRL